MSLPTTALGPPRSATSDEGEASSSEKTTPLAEKRGRNRRGANSCSQTRHKEQAERKKDKIRGEAKTFDADRRSNKAKPFIICAGTKGSCGGDKRRGVQHRVGEVNRRQD